MSERLTRLKLPRQDSILHLVSKLDHRIHLLLRLFTPLHESLEIRIDGVLSTQEVVDLMFFERESSFDRFLSGPIFSVSLTLDENLRFLRTSKSEMISSKPYCFVVDIAIPPKPDSLCAFSFLQTA